MFPKPPNSEVLWLGNMTYNVWWLGKEVDFDSANETLRTGEKILSPLIAS